MTSILTKKQQEELHYALLDYFQRLGLNNTSEAFIQETKLEQSQGQEKYQQLLEKKWTSVIRLQKKVLELEEKLSHVGTHQSNSSTNSKLPRAALHSLQGHKSPITSLAFHPLFNIIASASEDSTIKLWDYEAGEYEQTLKSHTKSVNSICFDPKGNYLISCSTDLTIKIWDVQNNYKCVKTLYGHDHTVSFVQCFEEFIYSCSRDKLIKQWNLSTGYCTKTLTGHEEWVRALDVSSDGKYLISCSNDQTLRFWELVSGECKTIMRGHEHVIEFVRFVPQEAFQYLKGLCNIDPKSSLIGQFAISCSRDKTLKLWDTNSGTCLYTFTGHDNWVRCCDFLLVKESCYLITSSDDKAIKIWDLNNGRCCRTIEAHEHFVSYVAVKSQTKTLASCGVDLTIKIYE